MGNIVAGEALRQGMVIKNYVLINAAVPAACFDADEGRIRQTSYKNATTGPTTFRLWDLFAPDGDGDAEKRNLDYRGTLEPLQGNLIIFFLPDDQATSFAWEVNNDATKPPAHDAPLNTNFEYLPNGYPGAKLLKVNVFTGQIEYAITNSGHKFEAMAYACRRWGKATGAWGSTEGAKDSNEDLSTSVYDLPRENSCFGDEHSAQFSYRIQQLKPFYDQLINSLHLGPPNP